MSASLPSCIQAYRLSCIIFLTWTWPFPYTHTDTGTSVHTVVLPCRVRICPRTNRQVSYAGIDPNKSPLFILAVLSWVFWTSRQTFLSSANDESVASFSPLLLHHIFFFSWCIGSNWQGKKWYHHFFSLFKKNSSSFNPKSDLSYVLEMEIFKKIF